MRHEPPTGQGWRKGGATKPYETGFLQSQNFDIISTFPLNKLLKFH